MRELQQREDNTALCQFPGTNGPTGSKIINILSFKTEKFVLMLSGRMEMDLLAPLAPVEAVTPHR